MMTSMHQCLSTTSVPVLRNVGWRRLPPALPCILGWVFYCLPLLQGPPAFGAAGTGAGLRVALAPIGPLEIEGPTERITLAQALEETRRNGPGPTLARALLAEAEAVRARRFDALLPGISVEGLRRHIDGSVQATLGDIQDADFSTAQIEGSLHYDLRLSNVRGEQAARRRVEAADSDRRDSERLAEETVLVSYLDIQRSRARLAAARAAAREAEDLAEAERARFESGQRLKADWLRQKARAAETLLLVADSQLATRLSSIRLSRTLGRDPTILLLPSEDDLEEPNPEVQPSPAGATQEEIAKLLATAERDRSDLAAARARLEAEERDTAEIRDAGLWPTLMFDVRRGLLGRNVDDAETRTSYGVWLRWDFLDTRGGTVRPRLAEADSRRTRRSSELDDLRRRIRGEILEALSRFQLATTKLDAAKEALGASEEAFEVRKVRARSGLESGLDLLEAEKDLERARFNQADALADLITADLRLKLVVGHPL